MDLPISKDKSVSYNLAKLLVGILILFFYAVMFIFSLLLENHE